jgi:DNA adenine methylase
MTYHSKANDKLKFVGRSKTRTDSVFKIDKVGVPPVKCQGIKTKLIPFILNNIEWDQSSTSKWIEPFLGSGVVAFNLAPHRALLCDTNSHIINLYRSIQSGKITADTTRKFLVDEGAKLEQLGEEHYYKIRERFNREGSPYDFIFLNRACFNGVMRFNRKGGFNVPFCKKPTRFTRSYITKIVNQIDWASHQMQGKDWEFRVSNWKTTLLEAAQNDFVYLDPPYIGRHTDYFNSWDEQEAIDLAETTLKLQCKFALSMWLENRYRKNDHIDQHWQGTEIKTTRHFYHVGASEDLRNAMDEALVIRSNENYAI